MQDILATFGLPAGNILGHAPIAAGTINTNVRVNTTEGPRFLRVNEGKLEEDVVREAAILEHLASNGFPTPRPLRNLEARPYTRWNGQLVSLFPWVDGRVLTRPELTEAHAAEVGAALARLHLLGASFPDHRPGRYEPDALDLRLTQVESGIANGAPASNDPALVDAMATLAPELRRLRAERAAPVPLGLIHGDLFVDNVLFAGPRGRESGRDGLIAVLDFEQAAWGRLIYDVAVTALAFAFGGDDFRFELLHALLAAYAAERPPTPAERRVFAAELRFAACRFALTRITDVYLKRHAGGSPGKDFRRYLLRLRRLEAYRDAGSGNAGDPFRFP